MPRAAISAFLGVVVTASMAGALDAAGAGPDPALDLRTETQKEALAKGTIAVRVDVAQPSRVRVRAKFSAGVSRNFRLDPGVKRVGREGSMFHLDLSAKQRRIIAAAIDVCAPVPVTIGARALDLARTPATKLDAELERPATCGP